MDFINCPGCGDELSTKYRPVKCYKCGPVNPDLVPPLPSPDLSIVGDASSHIILTSVSLLFCFIPALAGVIYSILVISDKKKGDYDLAHQHSQYAMYCAIAAYILGALGILAEWGNRH